MVPRAGRGPAAGPGGSERRPWNVTPPLERPSIVQAAVVVRYARAHTVASPSSTSAGVLISYYWVEPPCRAAPTESDSPLLAHLPGRPQQRNPMPGTDRLQQYRTG